MRRALIFFVLLLAVLGSGTAAAQESGQVGLVLSSPGLLGIQWQVSDRVALRPGLLFSWSSTDSSSSTSTSTSTSSSRSLGGQLAAVVYVGPGSGGLRPYFVPAFSFTSGTRNTESTSSSLTLPGTKSTSKTYTLSGAVGAEYKLAPSRLAVYGETGLSYLHDSASGTSASVISSSYSGTSNAVSLRGAVGLVWYF